MAALQLPASGTSALYDRNPVAVSTRMMIPPRMITKTRARGEYAQVEIEFGPEPSMMVPDESTVSTRARKMDWETSQCRRLEQIMRGTP